MIPSKIAAAEPFIEIFGITFNIDRVAFTIPIGKGYPIYWYAIIIVAGLLLAMAYGFKRAPKFGIDKDAMFDVVLYSFIGAIIGARAYYLIFDGKPLTSVKEIFALRDGGLAIYGGVIAAFVVGFILCKIKKVNVLAMFDIAALGFLIGQGIGRWGNFVNQEAYGTLTESIFGMTGSRIGKLPVHPCFLYESFFCLLGFVILHFISRKRQFDGQIISLYMIWYGVVRFFIEGLRTDSLYIGVLRVSQIVAFLSAVAGIALYVILFLRKKKAATENGEYNELFEDYEDLDEEIGEVEETEGIDEVAETEETEEAEEVGEVEAETVDETEETEKAEEVGEIAETEEVEKIEDKNEE